MAKKKKLEETTPEPVEVQQTRTCPNCEEESLVIVIGYSIAWVCSECGYSEPE